MPTQRRTPAQIKQALQLLYRRLAEINANDADHAQFAAHTVKEIFGPGSTESSAINYACLYPGDGREHLSHTVNGFIRMLEEERELAATERGAEICANGHLVSSGFDEIYDEDDIPAPTNHCAQCGEPVHRSCGDCQTVIPAGNAVPKFCKGCGHPYKWTSRAIATAHELADEMGGLNKDEREILARSIDDLVKDTPAASAAVVRFKRLLAKATGPTNKVIRDIVVSLVSEGVKRQLFGGGPPA